jgi:hypothetical protein
MRLSQRAPVVHDGWSPADAEAEANRAGLRSGAMLDYARDDLSRHLKTAAGG